MSDSGAFAMVRDDYEIYAFDSQAALQRFCDDRLFMIESDTSWYGLEKDETEWEAIVEKCESSWNFGLETVKAFTERLSKIKIPELKSRKRQTKFDTEGDDIDLDKLRQGDEKFFRKSEREQSTGSTEVTIFIDTSTPYFQDAEDILWRGAAAIALAGILEDKGYKCEIWVVNGSNLFSNKPGKPIMTACKVKDCQSPFDLSSLTNAVSGWFYRATTLTLLKTLAKVTDNQLAWGLGPCATPKPVHLDQLSQDENRVYVSEVFSFSGACQVIEREVEKLSAKETN